MPPRIWMPNVPMRLRLLAAPKSGVELPPTGTEGVFRTNEVVIETVKSMTKIETKRLLEAVYGVHVDVVHSLNRMGKRRSEHTMQAYKKNDFKRFYVKLSTPVDLPNVPKRIDQLSAPAAE